MTGWSRSLGRGSSSLGPGAAPEKLNGQLSRNQPQDLSTANKKPDDGSQKDGSPPQRTPSPGSRDKSQLDDQRSASSPLSNTPPGLDPLRPDVIPKSAPMNIPFGTSPLDLTPGSNPFPFNLLGPGALFSLMNNPPSPSILAQLAKAAPQDLGFGLLGLPPASGALNCEWN